MRQSKSAMHTNDLTSQLLVYSKSNKISLVAQSLFRLCTHCTFCAIRQAAKTPGSPLHTPPKQSHHDTARYATLPFLPASSFFIWVFTMDARLGSVDDRTWKKSTERLRRSLRHAYTVAWIDSRLSIERPLPIRCWHGTWSVKYGPSLELTSLGRPFLFFSVPGTAVDDM
jgi:hypothetical protein